MALSPDGCWLRCLWLYSMALSNLCDGDLADWVCFGLGALPLWDLYGCTCADLLIDCVEMGR
jgi:hypothetical protein